ncbi:MAG: adenylate/guanylate cyclase domain-containing protein [Chloroflexi bacterium]|nr:adenylate/guanylate cyclase domain-containing protein [Chloroflexota bacterium]
MEPRIQYTQTEDGVSIALTVIGSGPEVLVSSSSIFGDLHMYKTTPLFQAMFDALASRGRRVVLYDPRNVGSSEHRNRDYSHRALLADLQAVVDHVGVAQFSLYAFLQGCLAATAFAVAHPDRVKRLVLVSAFARGEDYYTTVPEIAMVTRMSAATMTAEEEDIFYRSSASIVTGFSDPEFGAKMADAMRTSMSTNEAAAFVEAIRGMDITALLPRVSVPTLVVFARRFMPALLPLTREVARLIPGAELIEVGEQGGQTVDPGGLEAIDEFLSEGEEQLDEPDTKLPSGTAIILFLDIADSTALTTKLGDAAYREKERALDSKLRAAITEAAGTPIEGKVLGDGVMAVFTSARSAIDAAQRCRDLGNEAGLPLHLGIHAGDVVREGNNVHGGAVQVAARVQSVAAPGEILVSATVRDLARTSAGVEFEDRGEHELKGIAEPQRLFAVRAEGSP